MVFRCKRYRIVGVPCSAKILPDSVFVVQRRWFGCFWLRQPIPQTYFDLRFVGWVKGSFVFYHIEDAADALCAWLRATHKPDDYTIYFTLPDG